MLPEIVTMGALVVVLFAAAVLALMLGSPNRKRLGLPISLAPESVSRSGR